MANLLVSHISHEKLLSLVTNSRCFHTAKAGWTSCIALLKNTLRCFFLLLCTLTPLEGPGGSKTPTFFFFFDLRASLRNQGSGSRSRDSLDLLPGFIYSSCLLSTVAPAVCKVFWLCFDERRRKTAPDWMLDLWCDIIPVVCPRTPWVILSFVYILKRCKDLVSDNWLPSARYALYYYISKIS